MDTNHTAIVNGLVDDGHTVESLANVGNGAPDIMVGVWCACGRIECGGFNVLMEIKNAHGTKRRLNVLQVEWHNDWLGQADVVENLEQARAIIERERKRWRCRK